jgi:hypothetical protein
MSCSGTYAEDNPETIPGISADIFYSGEYSGSPYFTDNALQQIDTRPLGSYIKRATKCDPAQGLICTGDIIPALPAVCVEQRKLPPKYDLPSRENLLLWGKRMLRMGGLNRENQVNGLHVR